MYQDRLTGADCGPGATSPVRLIAWGARLLYVGPAFELGAHRTATSALCVALDGEIDLIDPTAEDTAKTVARSVFVPAGVRHHLEFRCARIACLYADPLSGDGMRLGVGMVGSLDGVLAGHPLEGDFIGLATKISDGLLISSRARREIETMFELPRGEAGDAAVTATIARIRQDPTGENSLVELAAAAGLSPSRLRHKFREATGVPVRRFRLWSRLGFAMREVHRGANLTEAAHAAGFASSAHFSKAYRDMFGMAPSTFASAASRSPFLKAPRGKAV